MKKLLILCLLLLLVCGNVLPAYALGETYNWARIVKDNVYLYAEETSSKQMFVLEKSYYVRILDSGENMLHVSVMENETYFPQITGYVAKTDVELCSAEPVAPYYPTVRLSVTSDSAAIRLSPSTSASVVITATNTQKVSYYGRIENGKNWYYVCFGDKFGYVEVNSVSKPDIELHPTPLEKAETPPVSTTPSDGTPTEPSTTPTMPTSEILLIVFVVLLAVGLTLALFLPGNVKKRNVFEQDI